MKKNSLSKTLSAVTLLFVSNMAIAQATRTWVSGMEDDVNPGSRAAPCKTFAGAISKTATGGEINVIVPGGYGAVTITKSITIDGSGTFASILSSGTNGVIIDAGADGIVTLRHLFINGAGTGISGIKIIAAKKVIIEDCTLANFTQQGVEINTTAACTVILNNVGIHNAMNAVFVNDPGGMVLIDGCRLQSVSGGGINLMSGQVTVSNSNISDCGTGITGAGLTSAVLSNNVISNNNTALDSKGSISSAGNNLMVGNKLPGTTASVIKLQ